MVITSFLLEVCLNCPNSTIFPKRRIVITPSAAVKKEAAEHSERPFLLDGEVKGHSHV